MDGSVPLLAEEDIAAKVASLSNQHRPSDVESTSPATAQPLRAAERLVHRGVQEEGRRVRQRGVGCATQGALYCIREPCNFTSSTS